MAYYLCDFIQMFLFKYSNTMPLNVLLCFLSQSLHEHEVVNKNLKPTLADVQDLVVFSRTKVSTLSSTVYPVGSSPFNMVAFGRLLYSSSIKNKRGGFQLCKSGIGTKVCSGWLGSTHCWFISLLIHKSTSSYYHSCSCRSIVRTLKTFNSI